MKNIEKILDRKKSVEYIYSSERYFKEKSKYRIKP